MSESRFQPAADLLDTWRDELTSGKPPVLYPVGSGELARIEVGPSLVSLFGGAPGSGKTALAMQMLTDALAATPDLRALVCNVEMSPSVLLDRQLARLSGIDLTTIRHRRLGDDHADRLTRGLEALEGVAGRLGFVRPPFDLANVAASADAFGADMIALDYIQRIGPPGEHGDRRGAVDATMSHLRQFADAGMAILVVAALARSKDAKGRSSYSGDALSLASYRETSELEYGSDDAFILAPDEREEGRGTTWRVVLKHLKSRHGETQDLALAFDRRHQRFTPAGAGASKGKNDSGRLQSALQEVWRRSGRSTSRGRSRLRFETLNAFVDCGMAALKRAELATWLVLYRDTKPDGTARISPDDIARRAGIDRQTASRAVGSLSRRKMLQVTRRGGLNRGPSTYRVFPYPME